MCFLCRNQRRIGNEGKVNPRERDQVGLELSQVHVEGSFETKGGRDGRHNLTNDSVEVGVVGSPNVQLRSANVKDGLVVHDEGTVGMGHCVMRRQERVVRFHDGCRHLIHSNPTFKQADGERLKSGDEPRLTWGAGYMENSNLDFLP